MNLNNITVGRFNKTDEETQSQFPYYKHNQYIPIFKLPRLKLNISGDVWCSLSRYNTSVNPAELFPNGFDLYNYVLYYKNSYRGGESSLQFNTISKDSYKNYILRYIADVHNFTLTYSNSRHVSLYPEFKYSNDYISGLFYNTSNLVKVRGYTSGIPNIRTDHITIEKNGNILIIAAGSVFIVKEGRLIPLVMLMIDKSYITEYCFTNIVDFNVDKTKFQWWINSEIENYNCFSFLDKVIFSRGNSSNIDVVIKGNVEKYFDKPSLPNFNNIIDRLKFMESVKDNFSNQSEVVVLDTPKIELTDITNFGYSSKHLNSFIHSLHNKYTLIE